VNINPNRGGIPPNLYGHDSFKKHSFMKIPPLTIEKRHFSQRFNLGTGSNDGTYIWVT
jgi:hypothetical protein